MTFEVEAIKPRIGARIHTDRDTLLGEGTAEKVLALLDDHTVLIFPEIGLSDQDQLAFTDTLGPRVYYSSGVPGGTAAEKDVYKITLDPDINSQPDYVHSNFWWHFDGAYAATPPPRTTLLSAHMVADKGGQTEFASTYAGYESLSDEEKAEIDDLRAVHCYPFGMQKVVARATDEDNERWRRAIRLMRGQDPAKHHDDPIDKTLPIVWKHQNGRKSLVLSHGIDEVTACRCPTAAP